MSLTTLERLDIIQKLNNKIEQISQLASGHLREYLKDKLITPSWCLSLDSVMATIKHYESIMNQVISEQLKGVDPMNIVTNHLTYKFTT